MPVSTTVSSAAAAPGSTIHVGTPVSYGPVAIPQGANLMDLHFDVSTWLITSDSLVIVSQISFDGGVTWNDLISINRPGGATGDDGITVELVAGYSVSLQQPSNANRQIKGTATVSGHDLTMPAGGTLKFISP
jgi:hypothetical protein